MLIETDDYCTASEAARILGVSTQRVSTMAHDDGSLEVIQPWTHVALIGRRSLAEWVAGARQPRIALTNTRAWVLKRLEATAILDVDINVLRDTVREFIEEARPRWDNQRKDLWALDMASQIWRAATNAA